MRINDAYSLLTSVFIDWSGFLYNARGIRKDFSITWENRVSSMLYYPVMASDVRKLFEEKQYTFQVQDGSLIQIYYSYNRNGTQLLEASLAFYSANTDDLTINKFRSAKLDEPNIPFERNASSELTTISVDNPFDVSLEDSLGLISLEDGPVSWLRIDYAPLFAKGVLHHDCHMHLSTFPYSRFVVAGVPSPKQFVEFIAAFCYPEIYKAHRLNERGEYRNESTINSVNSLCFPCVDNEVYGQISHFRIPITMEERRR